jgi:hypothetical protein
MSVSRKSIPAFVVVSFFFLTAFIWTNAASAANLDASSLKKAWTGVTWMEAHVDQVKKSPHFVRPLKSKVVLIWTPKRIVWKVVEPNQVEMVLEDGVSTGMPTGSMDNTRIAMLARLLEKIFTVDIEGLQREFDLTFGEHEVLAVPKMASAPVRRLQIKFDADLRPATVNVETGSDQTELTFRSLKLSRNPGGPR